MSKSRTQIYLDSEQKNFLEDVAYILSRQNGIKISISELIRQGIEKLKQDYKGLIDETDLIISNPKLLKKIKTARKEKGFLTHEEVFGKD